MLAWSRHGLWTLVLNRIGLRVEIRPSDSHTNLAKRLPKTRCIHQVLCGQELLLNQFHSFGKVSGGKDDSGLLNKQLAAGQPLVMAGDFNWSFGGIRGSLERRWAGKYHWHAFKQLESSDKLEDDVLWRQGAWTELECRREVVKSAQGQRLSDHPMVTAKLKRA